MSSSPKSVQPHEIFDRLFRPDKLTQLFENKVAQSRAVGRDGIKIDSFKKNLISEVELIRKKVFSDTYKFTRYKERLISKGAAKNPRVLSIPTFRDRLTLRALCEFLSAVYPNEGVVKPHKYIKDIKNIISEMDSSFCFVRIDIVNYYPSIKIDHLIRIIRRRIRKPQVISLIRKALTTPTTGDKEIDRGVPQGLSISNILSSIYLNDLDDKLNQDWVYFRYVDDILIICDETKAKIAYNSVRAALEDKGLTCHELGKTSKTCIRNSEEGVDYLGFHINARLVSIRESSYKKMFATILNVFTEYKYRSNERRLIWKVNLKITGCIFNGTRYGWLFFFNQTDNLSQLARLDKFLRDKRRHFGLTSGTAKIKRFVKAYHELRYNLYETKYIPNFDTFTIQDMKTAIQDAFGIGDEEINLMEDAEIRERFFSMVKKEVSDLDKDLFEFFS